MPPVPPVSAVPSETLLEFIVRYAFCELNAVISTETLAYAVSYQYIPYLTSDH